MDRKDLNKLIQKHKFEGYIENAEKLIFIKFHRAILNIFTLQLKRNGKSSLDTKYYNAQILKLVKKNNNLYKEIREYNLLFRFFEKLNIKNGWISKRETPDFLLKRNNKMYGIEVTRIYTGNDWIAEKMHNDILAYRLKNNQISKYIHQSKYVGKIKTFQTSKGISIKAVKEKELHEDEVNEIKNKIFEKIRKQIDDYQKYDYNYIFAEIVFAGYEDFEKVEKLNKEIHFLISHLDVFFGEEEFHLILKIGNNWNDFDLKNGNYYSL